MTMFSSRPPFNDDPLPWVSAVTGARYAAPSKYGHARWYFAPRSEFKHPQRNRQNSRLKMFRNEVEMHTAAPDVGLSIPHLARLWLMHNHFAEGLDDDEFEHSVRVLTRLANLTKEEA